MKKLINIYGDDLVTAFDGKYLKNKDYKALAIIKNDVNKQEINGIITMNYEENFEEFLDFKIPPKTRKPAKLLSYSKTMEMIDKLHYSTIACVIDDMPYAYPMNHVLIDNHLYFHTAKIGHKLKAMNTNACVSFVEDLGNAYNGTHNFRTAQIFGKLIPCEDYLVKKKVLEKLISHLNNNHAPYNDAMQENCFVYEIEMKYILGRENLYLPKKD